MGRGVNNLSTVTIAKKKTQTKQTKFRILNIKGLDLNNKLMIIKN